MANFTLDISRFCKKANADTKAAVQKIAMEAFKRVILRSPVDTGRFRANWGCSVGSPWAGTVEVFDEDGRGTVVLASNVVKAWNAQGTIYLTNNLAYSIPLEYGHSAQAPGGMVRLTAAEMSGVAAQVVK